MGGGRFSENKETIGKEKSAIAQQRKKKTGKGTFPLATPARLADFFCFHLCSQGQKL